MSCGTRLVTASAGMKFPERRVSEKVFEALRFPRKAKWDKWFQIESIMGWLPLAVLPMLAFALRGRWQPWAFMWALAISIYLGLKWLTWWRAQKRVVHSAGRSLAYLLAWPGMDAESFLDRTRHSSSPRFHDWFWAVFKTSLGATLLWFVARIFPPELPLLRGWTGMLGLILFLHFGAFQIAALFWQYLGIDAQPIMSAPFYAQSLSEFWGQRWNLAFRQVSHSLIFLPLHKQLRVWLATLLAFLASGLIHDLVISVPARAGYGLPTGYFLLQGFGVIVERSPFGKQLGLGQGVRGWSFMALVAAVPVFWLFHPPFVMRVILPFMKEIHAL